MRLPEAKIKEAILHPDRMVRQCALDYFSGSYSQDPAVMPLAIQALETFGRAKAFRYLHALADLVQNEATVDWIIRELNSTRKSPEVDENYWYHISRLLLDADLGLVVPRAQEIVKAPNFHGKSVAEFEERLQLADWDADRCWTELERLCAQGMEKGIRFDSRRGNLIVEALARCGEKFVDQVLDQLNYQVKDYENDPMTWMEIMLVVLAGRMRLERAIPAIVKKLGDEGDFLPEESVNALAKIGTEEAVLAVTDGWPDTTWDYRLFATTVLEKIHTDATVRQCLALLPQEKDLDIKTKLAGALLNQNPLDGMEPVLHMIRAAAFDPQLMDLKSMLIANSTILGTTFPEYDAWKHEDEIKQARIDRNMKAMRVPIQLPPQRPQRPPPPAFTPQPPPDFSQPARFPRLEKPVGRNDPCPCGSGKKFKKCCLNRKQS